MSTVSEWECGYVAARATRARLGLGLEAPLVDAVLAIEELASVPVTILDLPAGLAGLQGRKHDRSFIFINGSESDVRQRFTLAHEFGHVELEHAGSVDYATDMFGEGRRPPAEVQADGFAAEFLAPLDGVRRWLATVGDPSSDLETVVRLADHFHVSAEVALYRLQQSRRLTKLQLEPIKARIDDNQHVTLSCRLGLGDFQDTISRAIGHLPRLPRKTLSEAANAYERGLLGVEQIAELLEVCPDVVQAEFDRRGVVAGRHAPDY